MARCDDLATGNDESINVSTVGVAVDGIELQDREFVAAVHECRDPNASVASVMPCLRTLAELEQDLALQAEG